MTTANPSAHDHPLWDLLVLAVAAAIALASAHGYAGGWNDGSRLATVECLVDHHTLAIDQSVFVDVPRPGPGSGPAPYRADAPDLLRHGTQDKLLIRGHFYSDKSPAPALLLAGVYQGWQWGTGWMARQQPGTYCYCMTVASSGLAYVIAVWCLFRVGRLLQLGLGLRLLLTASLALATVAPVYARHVNNHVLLLGVMAALMLGMASLSERARAGRVPWALVAWLGTLAGFGYTIDLGAGPVLLMCVLPWLAYRCRRPGPVALFLLAALPWMALHHTVNYAVGGTWKPANAVADYLQWPGSPFSPENMTGVLSHSPGHFLVYAAALLAGKRGFLGHNLPLFLALPGVVLLLRRRVTELPEILFACCWCGGTWLAYALTSNNYSGQCCSVRWFVPMLAPGYYVLALLLRASPRHRWDMLILTGWGTMLAALMWRQGPWMVHLVPLFWPIQAAAMLSWLARRSWRRQDNELSRSRASQAGRLTDAA